MKKLSQFNQYVMDGRDTVVYNVRTKAALKFENISINNTKKYILKDESFDYYKYGLVTYREEFQETKINYNNIRLDEDKVMINLIITYDCNCACHYCFEDPEKMILSDEDRTDEVIRYINKISKGKDLYLNYFGGEPLLDYKKILYIQDCLKGQKQVTSHITTNGTLVDVVDIEQLLENGITNYQITIDGDEPTHNQRRPLKEREGSSWHQTVSGLLRIANNPRTSTVNVRINVDGSNYKNIDHIFKSLPEKLQNNDKVSFYISPVFGNSNKKSKESLQNRSTIIKELWARIIEEELPIEIALPKFSPCTKDNLKGSFYIDLYGNIYSCGAEIGVKCKSEGFLANRNGNFYKRAAKEQEDTCFSCAFFYECMGGCDYEKESSKISCQFQYLKDVYDYYFLNLV